MSREFIIYTDESEKQGRYFANFYGGALVRSADLDRVRRELESAAVEAGLAGEVKWQKVSAAYLPRYVALADRFFDLVAEDRVKVRIMFTQCLYAATNLSAEQRQNEYYILYHQFLRFAFGLEHSNSEPDPVRLRIYLDNLPDTRERNAHFKSLVAGLQHCREFRRGRIIVPPDQIAEVRSHDHIVLQCLDMVLGAMQFRLNDKHREKAEGQSSRGSRTIAKEKLYRHLNRRIRAIRPGFNVGASTGTDDDPANRWRHPYRHWLFLPSGWTLDESRKKPRRRE